MEEVTKIATIQSQSVNETNNKFMGISKSIEGMNHVIDQINESGQEMLNKQERIIEIMTNLSAISEENAAGTEEASASVEEQTATMIEIAEASIVLEKLAGQMKEAVDRFQY